jgi:hypothetical protein
LLQQTSVCLVQWRMPFVGKSLGLMMRLLRKWRCGFERPQSTFTNKE